MAMLRGLAGLGFDTVFATPHQKAGQFMPSAGAIADAHRQSRRELAAAGLDLALSLGAENMWDDVFFQRLEADTIPSYDGGPAFLFELPLGGPLPVGLEQRLFSLRTRGKLPVMAHPERYEPLWNDPELVDRLAASCALVIDLAAVAGHHGRKRKKAARKLLERGAVHAAASDVHGPADIRTAADGIAWIRKRFGDRTVTRLLDDNPRRIAAGEHPDG
jgi:protein-tyrosine phosphatase